MLNALEGTKVFNQPERDGTYPKELGRLPHDIRFQVQISERIGITYSAYGYATELTEELKAAGFDLNFWLISDGNGWRR